MSVPVRIVRGVYRGQAAELLGVTWEPRADHGAGRWYASVFLTAPALQATIPLDRVEVPPPPAKG